MDPHNPMHDPLINPKREPFRQIAADERPADTVTFDGRIVNRDEEIARVIHESWLGGYRAGLASRSGPDGGPDPDALAEKAVGQSLATLRAAVNADPERRARVDAEKAAIRERLGPESAIGQLARYGLQTEIELGATRMAAMAVVSAYEAEVEHGGAEEPTRTFDAIIALRRVLAEPV